MVCVLKYTAKIYGQAEVAELADARDSKSRSFGSVGSIPSFGIITVNGSTHVAG